MNTEVINIPNKKGNDIHALLDLPILKEVSNYCIFTHCFTCNSQLPMVKHISRELVQYGFGVLRFDFTGLGRSEGEFEDTNFTHNLSDLQTINDFLTVNYKAPSLIIGHSLGGAAALVTASILDNIKAIATIGTPAEINHVTRLITNAIPVIKKQGYADVTIGGRPFRIKQQFINDINKYDLIAIVNKLKKPLLILHSPQDQIVEIENAAKLYRNAHHPKSFISLDGADHLLSRKADSTYAARSIASWAERYVELGEFVHLQPIKGTEVVAQLTLTDNFTTQISDGKHTLWADEPESVGGEDLGFSPYELLNAALGACTAMTLKLYAERKGWDLKEVTTHLKHKKDYLKDSQHPDSKNSKVDIIKKVISLKGNLSEDQRHRLKEIGSKCPVHRTLAEKTVIETELDLVFQFPKKNS